MPAVFFLALPAFSIIDSKDETRRRGPFGILVPPNAQPNKAADDEEPIDPSKLRPVTIDELFDTTTPQIAPGDDLYELYRIAVARKVWVRAYLIAKLMKDSKLPDKVKTKSIGVAEKGLDDFNTLMNKVVSVFHLSLEKEAERIAQSSDVWGAINQIRDKDLPDTVEANIVTCLKTKVWDDKTAGMWNNCIPGSMSADEAWVLREMFAKRNFVKGPRGDRRQFQSLSMVDGGYFFNKIDGKPDKKLGCSSATDCSAPFDSWWRRSSLKGKSSFLRVLFIVRFSDRFGFGYTQTSVPCSDHRPGTINPITGAHAAHCPHCHQNSKTKGVSWDLKMVF